MKVAAIPRLSPAPERKPIFGAFLEIAGYYRKYIPRYSDIASTLTDALRKTEPQMVDWDEEKKRLSVFLKAALSSQPLLSSPDYSRPFIVQCDASDRGMGAVLSQRDEGDQEHPVLYVSRKLTLREQVYSASEKECACLVWAVQKLACYIAGSKFIVEVDHCPLTWLQTMSSKNGRLLRWSLVLQQYTFEIRYKKGVLHGNADGLSRCP
uniref:Putative tick transposon n=1 Tax=Rhipicephalus microplus TaxID=6941 RepID=A0A6G5A9H4_RHIMP